MSTEKEKSIAQLDKLKSYLPKEKQEELAQLLSFWEKYKKKWEYLRNDFWNGHNREDFLGLISQYEESKQKFINWLSLEEKEMLGKLKWITKEKFYKEYLNNRIIYSWSVKNEKSPESTENKDKEIKLVDFRGDLNGLKSSVNAMKDKLEQGMYINLLKSEIWDEWVKILAKERKNSLQPWMKIRLTLSKIWYEWVKAMASERKNSLQPWMSIVLDKNEIWDEWVKAMASERKNSLQPWMTISLVKNKIWVEWVRIIAETWKNSLQPWMEINLSSNLIWAELARIIAETWKNSLQPWMKINLYWCGIWDEWAEAIMKNIELKEWVILDLSWNNLSPEKVEELKAREKSKQEKWINCKVLTWKSFIS